MKFKKLAVLAACGLIAAALFLVGCGSSTSTDTATDSTDNTASSSESVDLKLLKPGELSIITSPDYPPFENMVNGELEGFEIELAKAIAEEMGLKPNFVQMQFDTIIPAIVAGGQGDVGMSGFSVDPERAKEVDFSISYYVDDQAVAVMKDSGITEDDAEAKLNEAGMVIAVQTGTTGETYAQENFPNATIQGYGNSTDCFAAMQSGQADAVCTNLAVVDRMIQSAYNDAEIVIEVATGEEYAAVISKDNPDLLEQFDAAIKKLEENGTIEQLKEKWF